VEGNKFCLLGAIRDVWVEDDVQRIAFTAIKASIPGFETSTELRLFNFSAYDDEVATWNDDANREFKSIKEVLKRAKKAINWAIVGEKR
jgi:hypothetical protein